MPNLFQRVTWMLEDQGSVHLFKTLFSVGIRKKKKAVTYKDMIKSLSLNISGSGILDTFSKKLLKELPKKAKLKAFSAFQEDR